MWLSLPLAYSDPSLEGRAGEEDLHGLEPGENSGRLTLSGTGAVQRHAPVKGGERH